MAMLNDFFEFKFNLDPLEMLGESLLEEMDKTADAVPRSRKRDQTLIYRGDDNMPREDSLNMWREVQWLHFVKGKVQN